MKANKNCPRCEFRMPVSSLVCPSCGLNYAKFNQATNQAGKKALREGRKEDVIYRKGCPADVSKIKLMLFAIFLGFVGGHHYYVGRYGKGLFCSIFFAIGLTNAILTGAFHAVITGFVYELLSVLVLIWGAVLLMWIFDLVNICLNKYKIPVSLDI